MSEQTIIENVIIDTLIGDTRENALDFIAFLRANDYTVVWDGAWWCVHFKDVCPMLIGVNTGGVKFGALFNDCSFNTDSSVDNEIKEAAWAHVQNCFHHETEGEMCGCGDQPGPVEIFGKEFHTCKSPLTFIDPEAQTLANMKKLLLLANISQC